MENIINVLIEKTKNGYSAFSNEVSGLTTPTTKVSGILGKRLIY